jgi:hypothetical protein
LTAANAKAREATFLPLRQVFHLKVTHPVSQFNGSFEPLCC